MLVRMKPSYKKDQEALKTRLHRIEGQVRGVSRMVDEEAYCIDVLTQINAIKAAIDQVGLLLLEDHIKGCVTTAVREGDQTKVEELVKAVERFANA
jgi:DNA-binding FrmR family transcriptional regulator